MHDAVEDLGERAIKDPVARKMVENNMLGVREANLQTLAKLKEVEGNLQRYEGAWGSESPTSAVGRYESQWGTGTEGTAATPEPYAPQLGSGSRQEEEGEPPIT